jgi:hypothetical protein
VVVAGFRSMEVERMPGLLGIDHIDVNVLGGLCHMTVRSAGVLGGVKSIDET